MKVLYLEDEQFLGRIVTESLTSRGYTVKHVLDGKSALGAIQSFHPDICVLDVMVPKIDGFEVGETINNTHANLPIIYLTAKTQNADVLKGFQNGGNDYLKKPFSMEELIVRIENLISLTKSSPINNDSVVTLGQYTFEKDQFKLKHPNETIELSFREKQLLKMLVKNKNAITDRKEILIQLWGDDSYYNSRNLDVYIRKIRIYLRHDPTLELKTLRGVGYFLKE